jgi:glycosyltransferase involved in cell wall biosynthesis
MIKFVVCVWNAEKYIKNCIRTLKSQIDVDFKVFIIDDVSTDNTVETIKSLIVDDNRFNLIVNSEKKFKLKNLDELITTFDNDDIVIELDGDDFLLNPDVVSDIRNIYSDEQVWLTNGSFMYSNGNPGFSSKCNPDTVRKDVFTFSHLRTWKTFLWKSIPKNYLKDDDGEYFKSAADVAYTFSLLELAGEENYRFLPKLYYVYNAESPYNDHKPGSATGGGHQEQVRCSNIIRNKPKLKKLYIE